MSVYKFIKKINLSRKFIITHSEVKENKRKNIMIDMQNFFISF